jgi:hypothetical protein
MTTPLRPFIYPGRKDSGDHHKYYTSEDATDLNELGIAYGLGSLSTLIPEGDEPARSGKSPFDIISAKVADPMKLAGSDPNAPSPFSRTKWVHNISRNQYAGSFVVRLYALGHDGKEVEVGREAILSRWSVEGCGNCQSHPDVELHVPLDAATLELLERLADPTGQKAEVKWLVKIQAHDGWHDFPIAAPGDDPGGEPGPKVDDI